MKRFLGNLCVPVRRVTFQQHSLSYHLVIDVFTRYHFVPDEFTRYSLCLTAVNKKRFDSVLSMGEAKVAMGYLFSAAAQHKADVAAHKREAADAQVGLKLVYLCHGRVP